MAYTDRYTSDLVTDLPSIRRNYLRYSFCSLDFTDHGLISQIMVFVGLIELFSDEFYYARVRQGVAAVISARVSDAQDVPSGQAP